MSEDDFIYDVLPDGWELADESDPFGSLVCPHGHVIEQDGSCPDGCSSPLLDAGLI